MNHFFIIYSLLFIRLCSFVWHVPLCFFLFHLVFVLPQSYTISPHISCVSPSINCLSPLLFLLLSPSFPSSLFQGSLPFVIDPCPGCLGIDWLSPCHWSSLSILTRFGHPLRCGQRVGERGRYTRCSAAPGDKIKMNERQSKTKRNGEENDGGRQCVKQLVTNLIRLLHFSKAFLVLTM